jgi:hypothetical protein
MMNANELLKQILAGSDSRLNVLREELDESSPESVYATSGDGTPLLSIYGVRAEINKHKGGGAQGYEDLLLNLRAAQDRQVAILVVNMQRVSFVIFVDVETKRLYGILSGDRRLQDEHPLSRS